MAGRKPPGGLKKEHLNSVMYVSCISQEVEKSYCSFQWPIENYSELQDNVFYEYFIGNVNWHLSLIKENECIKIIVTSEAQEDNVTCSVVYGSNSVSVTAKKTAERKYEIVLPLSLIEDQKNESLKEHSLIFNFKYEKLDVKKEWVGNRKKDWEFQALKLANDLQKYEDNEITASAKEKCNNFTIKTNGREISVPKALFAARSEYFKEFGDKDSITLNANYELVSIAVHYLYTGALLPFKEDTVREHRILQLRDVPEELKKKNLRSKCMRTLQLLDIAQTLKIKSLQSKCKHLAQDFLSEVSAAQIPEGRIEKTVSA